MNNPHIISYASPSHEHCQVRLAKFLDECGFTHTEYTTAWLEEQREYSGMQDILTQPRGAGYWAWKPLILIDALIVHPWVVYLDCSIGFEYYSGIFDKFHDHDLAAVNTEFNHAEWTKRDCFVIMNCDEEKYHNANQIWAGIISAKQRGLNYIWEWLQYCGDHRCITDSPSVAANFNNFRDHRHDQSILTNIIIKYNLGRINTPDFKDVR